MKTEISRFCEASLTTLNTLPAALTVGAESIERLGDPSQLQKPLAAINDVRARLRSLVDKLESQQAYLLIFGPLKSGKSTLMNAISGAYVSEVTSLPGYPCLVYVSHSSDPRFSVTRYNGRETVFANGRILKDVIADSHVALAEQIRETEKRGGDFDPREHFTEAIRRVDVKVPVQSLSESSTVLVDTPGLYSRMNFGYDVLTREFRNSAACAVFVVKTDNLFLEQVFAEFNQLLDLFSRIFLVINVDANKRDLQSDGTLQPSIESQHPEKIIDAFKTLSMAGPLRKAYENGRVRIHAVDLMNAASGLLGGRTNGQSPEGSPEANGQREFSAFLRDLTQYLNSSDYTVEFIRDSLRQGYLLCEEMRGLIEDEEFLQLRERQRELDNEMIDIDDALAATDRLLQVDWEATFHKVREESITRGKQAASARTGQLKKELAQAFDRWLGTPDSLKALEEKYWNPLLAGAAVSLGDESRAALRELTSGALGGSEPAALVMNDLHAVEFSLLPIAQAAQPKLKQEEALENYRLQINPDEVPVRKTFMDWILFRSQAGLRQRVFGEDGTAEISPEEKQKRLTDTTRTALLQIADDAVRAKYPALPEQFAESLITGYVYKFRTDVSEGLRLQREELLQERAERQAPFDANSRVLSAMEQVQETAVKAAADLEQIAQQESALLNPGGETQETEPPTEPAAATQPANSVEAPEASEAAEAERKPAEEAVPQPA